MLTITKNSFDAACDYLHSWLRYKRAQFNLPGIQLAASFDHNRRWSEAVGWAHLKPRKELQRSHLMRIASQSKTITSAVLLRLVDQGKLSLDQPVTDHLPELKHVRQKRWARITVRHLLSHGSGFTRDSTEHPFWTSPETFPTLEELFRELDYAPFVLPTDRAFKYSNLGFAVLGSLIERVSDQPFHDAVRSLLLLPMGYNSTFADFQPSLSRRHASGYGLRDDDGNRSVIPHAPTRAAAAATGFCSSTEDILSLFSDLFDAQRSPLSEKSLRAMLRAHYVVPRGEGVRYGLGTILFPDGRKMGFGHAGSFPGFQSRTTIFPSLKLGLSLSVNCIDGPAKQLFDEAVLIFKFFARAGNQRPAPSLQKFSGRFLSIWRAVDIAPIGKNLYQLDPHSPDIQKSAVRLKVEKDCFMPWNDNGFGRQRERFSLTKIRQGGKTKRAYRFPGGVMVEED